MPPLTVSLAAMIFAAGAGAGALGIVLGLGGGIFLVRFLTLAVGFSVKSAAAISLTTVIATSSAVAAARAGNHLLNLRFGMLLEVATAAGSLLGGVQLRSQMRSVPMPGPHRVTTSTSHW